MRITYVRGIRIEMDGGRLRELRLSRGETLTAVGDAIGRTAAAVCSLEHERWPPSLETAEAILRHYGDAASENGAIVIKRGWVADEEKHLDSMYRKRVTDDR